MNNFWKSLGFMILVVLLVPSVMAQEEDALEEEHVNDLFSIAYPAGWLIETTTSVDQSEITVRLYSTENAQDQLQDITTEPVLETGDAAVIITASTDDPAAVLNDLVAELEATYTVGAPKSVIVGDLEGTRVVLIGETSEGAAYVVTEDDVDFSVLMLVPLGQYDAFLETLTLMLDSLVLAGETADEPAQPTAPQADLLTYGTTVETFLTVGQDEYRFEGATGERVIITMRSLQLLRLDPLLRLRDPGGSTIAEDDDSLGLLDARLEVVLPEDGIYTIVATSFTGLGRGGYTLELALPTSTVATSPTIAYGDVIDQTLTPGGEDNYTFSGNAGDTITIRYESSRLALDPYLELRSADGTLLADDDDSGGGLDAQITAFELPADGDYVIVVRTFGGRGGGAYTLTLTQE